MSGTYRPTWYAFAVSDLFCRIQLLRHFVLQPCRDFLALYGSTFTRNAAYRNSSDSELDSIFRAGSVYAIPLPQ